MTPLTDCIFCFAPGAGLFHTDKHRRYLRCGECQLTFVPSAQHLCPVEEKRHYDRHENNPADQGYRRFLSRLFDPLVDRLEPGARGLDFGSGPGPTLSLMFGERGFPVAIYDVYYAPDASVLVDGYDFITATEVVEHLADPRRELERLWSLLRPGGWLGLMTKLALDEQAFSRWHYKTDPTHIAFFSRHTFEWLARHWQAEVTFCGADVILLRKPARRSGYSAAVASKGRSAASG